ncbi:copper chaperone PCu(A)C [Peterkaempfera sp. SMS 1(5)a]|uniref:copper chaperone PCu(A)C n=1 Tax=Peterkaempfera podocarpi TaxID=3232308 RepID=UPI00366E6478
MIRPRAAAAVAAGAAAVALAGCGSPAGGGPSAEARLGSGGGVARISVSDPYIPLPASSGAAAGYLTLHNSGGTADRLLRVASPDAGSVTMHRSTTASMEPLESLTVPAHGSAAFSRGADHLMIIGLTGRPQVGRTVELDLTFAASGTIAVKVPIQPVAYRPPGAGN